MFKNPRRGRQPKNFTTNVPKILDLKSSSEQIFSENCRWVPPLIDRFQKDAIKFEKTQFQLFQRRFHCRLTFDVFVVAFASYSQE